MPFSLLFFVSFQCLIENDKILFPKQLKEIDAYINIILLLLTNNLVYYHTYIYEEDMKLSCSDQEKIFKNK